MKIYQAILFFVWFTLIIAIPPFALNKYGYNYLLIHDFWLVFGFMSVLTLIVVAAILIVRQMYPTMFSEGFMGGTAFKILACLVFIVVFLKNNTVDKPVFAADFFYIYFLNTAFEVYILLRTLRHKNLR
ncbi:MAG: hypothetical protein JWQ79_194 [Mucilaginibacter sp.]|jgi:hypothetical protein|nr:hypothetical protein [Mucilaginibacter sp.]